VRTLNLGILAHVDAGKTSLTERLLFTAGVIDEIGSVDDGSTQTDSLALERQRGITIKSAVVSFVVGDVTINLIDTPGHPDFIAEVERVLGVLDGAVLVVSAVEGVQAQTRVLMRTLQRLGIPTLIFVNKVDRGGADAGRTMAGIAEKLTPAVIALGSARDQGTAAASCVPYGPGDREFTSRLTERLADHDDELLAAYLGEASISWGRLRRALAAQSRRGLVHPVFCGSAITGAGADALLDGIARLLPAAPGDGDRPASGTVFKVERGAAGEKIAYVRMFSGTLRVRDRLCFGGDRAGRVTGIAVFEHGAAARRDAVTAGQIGRLWGLAEVRIGDVIGAAGAAGSAGRAGAGSFPPPTLETVVVPCRRSDRGALYAALVQLAEQDPLIRVRQDDVRQEISVSLYGEVQKEVIQATLASDFGLEVGFRETTTICIERPAGGGAAVEVIGQPPNPFLAGIGLRVDPADVGAGVTFRLEIELGALPLAFLKAIEETVHLTLHQGLYGWQVTDAVVTLTHSGYWPRQSHAHATFDKSMSSTAGDFRNLTPLVLMAALRQAGTQVLEPVHLFRLEVPADTVGAVLPVLARLRAVPRGQTTAGQTTAGQTTAGQTAAGRVTVLEGDIPAARTHELQQLLPALTRGEGVLESAFDHYQAVRGSYPARARWDDNPLDRQEYLLRVARPGLGRPR
jgi:ribosomal protection tetracycline resistance protein